MIGVYCGTIGEAVRRFSFIKNHISTGSNCGAIVDQDVIVLCRSR